MSTQHNGDKMGTLVTPTHQEVQMVSCTVCRKAKGRQKWKFQRHLLQLWKVRSFGQVLLCKKVEKQKERERRETAKVGMTVKVGQSERDGQKVMVGTRQVKVGSNKGQQERTMWNVTRRRMMFS